MAGQTSRGRFGAGALLVAAGALLVMVGLSRPAAAQDPEPDPLAPFVIPSASPVRAARAAKPAATSKKQKAAKGKPAANVVPRAASGSAGALPRHVASVPEAPADVHLR